jgi:hypothetical protein
MSDPPFDPDDVLSGAQRLDLAVSANILLPREDGDDPDDPAPSAGRQRGGSRGPRRSQHDPADGAADVVPVGVGAIRPVDTEHVPEPVRCPGAYQTHTVTRATAPATRPRGQGTSGRQPASDNGLHSVTEAPAAARSRRGRPRARGVATTPLTSDRTGPSTTIVRRGCRDVDEACPRFRTAVAPDGPTAADDRHHQQPCPDEHPDNADPGVHDGRVPGGNPAQTSASFEFTSVASPTSA